MKKNETSIDDFFKSELGSYTEAPPPAAWDALEKKLDGKRPPRFANPRFGFIALVSLILILSIPVIRNMKEKSDSLTENITTTEASQVSNGTKSIPVSTANAASVLTPATPKENIVPNNDKNIKQVIDEQIVSNKTNPRTENQIHDKNIDKKYQPGKIQTQLAGTKNTLAKTGVGSIYGSNTSQVFENENNIKELMKGPSESLATEGTRNDISPVAAKTKEIPVNSKPTAEAIREHKLDSIIAKAKLKKPTKKPQDEFNRFEFGVKAGFERGFDNEASKKGVFSPYLQYNLSPKFAVMTQPSVKYASYNLGNVGSPKSYYKENNDSVVVTGPAHSFNDPGTGAVLGYITPIYYGQTRDSIVKTYTFSGNYMEYELPILVKYNITKQFSVYGGVNIIYSKSTGFTENTYSALKMKDTSFTIFSRPGDQPTKPLTSSVLNYQGTEYSNYKGPLYPPSKGGVLRFGYMLGLSHEFTHRWLFDGLVQQGMMNQNMVKGYNANQPLSAPYFRFTLGYKIIQ